MTPLTSLSQVLAKPIPGPLVLVCGGREYSDAVRVWVVLDLLGPRGIVEGGARGADAIARGWAKARNVPCHTVPADWERHGKAAGPIRNRAMLDQYTPELVVAFPGGRGTANMIAQATTRGVRVIEER